MSDSYQNMQLLKYLKNVNLTDIQSQFYIDNEHTLSI